MCLKVKHFAKISHYIFVYIWNLKNTDETHIVIINWEGSSNSTECLDSILSQNNISPIVHIWDNNSSQKDQFNLQKAIQGTGAKYYQSKENIGYTKATNALIREIIQTHRQNAKYILLINNDTVLTQNYVTSIVEFAERNDADVVSSKMLKYFRRKSIDNLGHQMLTSGEIIPITKHRISYSSEYSNFGACAGAALYSIRCIEKIGLFDTYFETGYEDAEYGARAKIMGLNVLHSNDSVIYHKGGESLKKIFNQEYAIKQQKNILYTVIKLYPLPLTLIVVPMLIMRNMCIILLSAIFLRFNYTKILARGTWSFLVDDMKLALNNRINKNNRNIGLSSISIFRSQSSSLIFDIKRVIRFLIFRKSSALDKYR